MAKPGQGEQCCRVLWMVQTHGSKTNDDTSPKSRQRPTAHSAGSPQNMSPKQLGNHSPKAPVRYHEVQLTPAGWRAAHLTPLADSQVLP